VCGEHSIIEALGGEDKMTNIRVWITFSNPTGGGVVSYVEV